jgi:small subunit ribosomal protein S8
MMTDLLSDMLTRIKNAGNAKHEQTAVPFSKINEKVAAILMQEGFLGGVETVGEKAKKQIIIKLKYNVNKKPVFSELVRCSRRGKRVYLKKSEIRSVRSGRGIAILSTSKGVMKDDDARKKGLGGELILTVW